MTEESYFVATIKPWNLAVYQRRRGSLRGKWKLIERAQDLTIESVENEAPRYIFFPHWSWKVPREILERVECVCFHMTDLPFGRGGSPLQNLIQRGYEKTMLTALRMTQEVDGGPVYMKRPLELDGSAQEIFERAAEIVFDMIGEIVAYNPEPKEQIGEPTNFARRRPEQSALPDTGSLRDLYDHIRMLDAQTYPAAFLHHGPFCLEFSGATQSDDAIVARVKIRRSDVE